MNNLNSDSQPHSQNKPNVPIITINKNKSVTIISLDKKKTMNNKNSPYKG